MITSEYIKQKAIELGAAVCGIGSLDLFEGEDIQRDPKMILPGAKCIIGFGFAVPRGLYRAMEENRQYYTYTTEGVKYIDEEFAEIFLFKIGNIIEDAGYDACLQRTVPNLRVKGDKTTNPEVVDTFELISDPVEEGKPAPDVIIDFGKAAKACGIGEMGLNGKVIAKGHGPFMRYAFIITDMPLETDEPLTETLCDKCGECIKACPGNAISADGLDTWQCAVYYNGANGTKNPFMPPEAFSDREDRMEIINGTAEFDSEEAQNILRDIYFYPPAKHSYRTSICGRACDRACYIHLEEKGLLKKGFVRKFREKEDWKLSTKQFETGVREKEWDFGGKK